MLYVPIPVICKQGKLGGHVLFYFEGKWSTGALFWGAKRNRGIPSLPFKHQPNANHSILGCPRYLATGL